MRYGIGAYVKSGEDRGYVIGYSTVNGYTVAEENYWWTADEEDLEPALPSLVEEEGA